MFRAEVLVLLVGSQLSGIVGVKQFGVLVSEDAVITKIFAALLAVECGQDVTLDGLAYAAGEASVVGLICRAVNFVQ